MKKIEVYITDAEFEEFESKVEEFEAYVKEHQNDGFYSDEERAEIINTYGAIPLYASKGLKKKLKEIDTYIAMYSKKDESEARDNKQEKIELSDDSIHETEIDTAFTPGFNYIDTD